MSTNSGDRSRSPAPQGETQSERPPATNAWRRWGARVSSPWVAVMVLAAFYAALLGGVRDKSLTVDEPGHATAGYTYWKLGDYRFDPENGNFPKRWFALPLLAAEYRFPAPASAGWKNCDLFETSQAWFHRSGNDTLAMVQKGRAMAGVLAVALGAAIWLWSRRVFGPLGGLLSLLLYVLNPTVLANGALMTSDLASALAFLLALAAYAALLRRLTPGRVLLSALAAGALCVVKMSALIMFPVALLLGSLLVFSHPAMGFGARWRVRNRGQRFLVLGATAAIHFGVIAVIIWAAYGFRFSAFAPEAAATGRFQFPWERVLELPRPAALLNQLALEPAQRQRAIAAFRPYPDALHEWTYDSYPVLASLRESVLTAPQARLLDALRAAPPAALPARLAAWARDHRLLPEAYLYGNTYVWSMANEHLAFLNGETRLHGGFHGFFPYTFLVKTPLALFALLGLAAYALGRSARAGLAGASGSVPPVRELVPHLVPLAVFSAVYGAAAIASDINIGHRHLLPIYPALFIGCGAAAPLVLAWARAPEPLRWSRRTLGAGLVGLLVGTLAVEAGCWFPDSLAYFNGIVRPAQAYRHLVDSSLDWGQDLPAVARALARQPPAALPAYLAYFGAGDPRTYDITARRVLNGIPSRFTILPLPDPSARQETIGRFLHEHPDYDPNLTADLRLESGRGLLFLQRASAIDLGAGTYFVSATALQLPFFRMNPGWNAEHESHYQALRKIVQPLLADDPATRGNGLSAVPLAQWDEIWNHFEVYRFARLAAFLRRREPDDQINHSILVYRLTGADLAAALNGPSP